MCLHVKSFGSVGDEAGLWDNNKIKIDTKNTVRH